MKRFLNLFLLVLLVGMSFLPPHQGLVQDKDPFYAKYLQPVDKMDCHCDTHKELAQAFQKQYKDFNGKIAYMVSCSNSAQDMAFSSLKMIIAAPGKTVALTVAEQDFLILPASLNQSTRQLSPPEPPPKLS